MVHALVALFFLAAPSPAAVASFDKGEKALAAGKVDDAVAAYKEAIRVSPGYAAALNGLGSATFRRGMRAEAIGYFKMAIASDPGFKLAYFNLGYAHRKGNELPAAVKAYEKYVELEPADPDGYYGLAETQRGLGDGPKALAAYRQYVALEKRPSEQKLIDRAREQIAALEGGAQPRPIQLASALAPTPAAAPARDGGAGAPQAPPAPAAPAAGAGFADGGSPSPALAASRIAEGDRLMQDRRYRDATFAYLDASNADPSSLEALFKLASAFAVLGYYQQAILNWERVIALTQDPAIRRNAQDNIGRAQARIAQLGGGSPQAQNLPPGSGPVAETTKQKARAAYEAGVAQVNVRDYAGGAQTLGSAISLDPTMAVAYVARGSALIGLKRYAEALADYQYAARLDPGSASPLYGIAECYRALGRPADARGYYERYAASTAPDVRPAVQEDARKKAERLRQPTPEPSHMPE